MDMDMLMGMIMDMVLVGGDRGPDRGRGRLEDRGTRVGVYHRIVVGVLLVVGVECHQCGVGVGVLCM